MISRVERTIAERVGVEEELHELGLTTADSQTNFSWIDLGGCDEEEIVTGLGPEFQIAQSTAAVPPGT